MLAEKIAKPTIGKVQKNYILPLQAQIAKSLTRLLFSELSIVAIIPCGRTRYTICLFYPFRKTVAAGQKHDLHGSSNAEHSLDKTSGCQSLIVWMWGKDHESSVLRKQWLKQPRLCSVCPRSEYQGTDKKA
jgi:hypothetical protein